MVSLFEIDFTEVMSLNWTIWNLNWTVRPPVKGELQFRNNQVCLKRSREKPDVTQRCGPCISWVALEKGSRVYHMDGKHSTNTNTVCQCKASLHSRLCVAHNFFLRDKVDLLSNLHGEVQPQVRQK